MANFDSRIRKLEQRAQEKKGKKLRMVPMSPELKKIILDVCPDATFDPDELFPEWEDKELSPGLQRMVADIIATGERMEAQAKKRKARGNGKGDEDGG